MTSKFELGYTDGAIMRQAKGPLAHQSARTVLEAHPEWSTADAEEYLNGHEDGLSGDGYRLALSRCQDEISGLRALVKELAGALKSTRLGLHAWRAARDARGLPYHPELMGIIAEADAALAKARKVTP